MLGPESPHSRGSGGITSETLYNMYTALTPAQASAAIAGMTRVKKRCR